MSKMRIRFKHLALVTDSDPLNEDQFLYDFEQLLRKYAGSSWSYQYSVEETEEDEQ